MLTIDDLRQKIEEIDVNIIKNLASRHMICKKIGQLKREEGLLVIDKAQEKKPFEFYEHLCETYQLPKEWIIELFEQIIAHSRFVQQW